MNNLSITVLYPYWWAICCMFQNHWVLIVYWNDYMRTLVPETGVSDRDNCLPMAEIRASATGVPVCVSVYWYLCLWCCSWRLSLTTCGTVKVKRPWLVVHLYICRGIIFLLFYSCWQAITRMLPNQNANASVTITALLGLWCRRRVPQTGMIFYPSLRCVLLAPESLMCISL